MSDYTDNYNLLRLTGGTDFTTDDYKFTDADRVIIDRLLALGAELHRHTGGSAFASAPDSAPVLTLDTTSGSIPAGTRVYYKYTLIDTHGIETGPSPEAYIDTPAIVSSPNAPELSYESTGGSLQPGVYYYALTAYTDFNNFETEIGDAAFIEVEFTSETNVITLTLPDVPGGADGFNIYRKRPTSANYKYLDSVDMSVATPPTEYVDDGSATEDADRYIPTENTTTSTNTVTVGLPGATPSIPLGYAWRIYRTYIAEDYSTSLLVTNEDDVIEYDDTGSVTSTGQPPSSTIGVGSPSQVLLTDGTEVQGYLPADRHASYVPVEFYWDGVLEPSLSESAWPCPFDQAQIVGVFMTLGPGYYPASTAVICDLLKGTGTDPTYTTMFNTGTKPQIATGNQVSTALAVPGTTTLERGDTIIAEIEQAGGGATPTDQNLTMVVLVAGWLDESTSRSWG